MIEVVGGEQAAWLLESLELSQLRNWASNSSFWLDSQSYIVLDKSYFVEIYERLIYTLFLKFST